MTEQTHRNIESNLLNGARGKFGEHERSVRVARGTRMIAIGIQYLRINILKNKCHPTHFEPLLSRKSFISPWELKIAGALQ